MGYHPRIETTKFTNFLTTRTIESRLWFVNCYELEQAMLGYVAKYAARYKVRLYALAIQGNHTQGPARFTLHNRSHYMRDLNSSIARCLPKFTSHRGGKVWARRYSNELLPGDPDVEEYFFYTVLQPVKDGLVSRIAEYPGYNCFHDAIWGIKKEFKAVRWGDYNAALKRDLTTRIQDFTEIVTLEYERLPGYEHLSQKEYAHLMMDKLEQRRQVIIKERAERGLGFVGAEKLKRTIPGSLPRSTKTSTKDDHRPRVLSICDHRRAECKAWYFENYFAFKEASKKYRDGDLNVSFPFGTYPPHRPPYQLAAQPA